MSLGIFFQLFEVIFPVFFIIGIGYWFGKKSPGFNTDVITTFSGKIGVPAMLFYSLAASTTLDFNTFVKFGSFTFLFVGFFAIIGVIILKIFKRNIVTELSPLILPNTGNLGLPLSFFAFGQVGLSYAIIIFSIMVIFSFTYGIWVVSGKTNFIKVIKEPIVLSTILGGIALFLKLEIPDFLSNSLELTGQIAIPLMLITLGYSVAKLTFSNLNQSLFLVIYRTLICLFIAIAISYAFDLSKVPSAILILQLTTPIAVTSYLLSEKYNRNPNEVAGLVVVSTFFSIFYIPIILSFLI